MSTETRRRGGSSRSVNHALSKFMTLIGHDVSYAERFQKASQAFIDGFYFRPRIDHELLAEHSEGLICLSACLASEINRPLLHGDEDKAACHSDFVDASAARRLQDEQLVQLGETPRARAS